MKNRDRVGGNKKCCDATPGMPVVQALSDFVTASTVIDRLIVTMKSAIGKKVTRSNNSQKNLMVTKSAKACNFMRQSFNPVTTPREGTYIRQPNLTTFQSDSNDSFSRHRAMRRGPQREIEDGTTAAAAQTMSYLSGTKRVSEENLTPSPLSTSRQSKT